MQVIMSAAQDRTNVVSQMKDALRAYVLTLQDPTGSAAVRDRVQAISAEGIDVEVVLGQDGRKLSATDYYKIIVAKYCRSMTIYCRLLS